MTTPMPVRLATPEDVEQIHQELRDAPYIAIDTEFHAERRYLPKLYLVQFYIPDGNTWIIDPLVPDLLKQVGEALVKVPQWILHAGHQDIRLLHHALGAVASTILDTQIAAGLSGDRFPASLTDLLDRHLDVHLKKQATLSDWSQRPLTEGQLEYAVDDVVLLPELWSVLHRRVNDLGRQAHLEAACAEAVQTALTLPEPESIWRRSPMAASLGPEDAAVFRDLIAWRERLSRKQDRPPHFIAGDSALRHLARTRPQDRAALAAHRRLPRGLAKQYAEPVLSAIRRAEATPEDQLPRHVRRDTPLARRATWLDLLGIAAGTANDFSPRLVLPRHLVEQLLLSRAVTRTEVADVIGSWRDDLMGELVTSALAGAVAIGLEPEDVAIRPSSTP
jgi:ribonuclease D